MPDREAKTLSFTPQHADFVRECVASGRYQNASEVVRAGLRLLQDQESERAAALDQARAMIEQGAAELDRGETVPGEEVFARWEERIARRRREAEAHGATG